MEPTIAAIIDRAGEQVVGIAGGGWRRRRLSKPIIFVSPIFGSNRMVESRGGSHEVQIIAVEVVGG